MNGVSQFNNGGHAPYAAGGNLTIGTTNGNNGDFNGAMDDIRWYNNTMSDVQIAAISSAMLNADVPEPTAIAAMIGGAGIVIGLEFLRFCGLGCAEHNDSHEQQQSRSALRPGV